jgi:hypothetical protein
MMDMIKAGTDANEALRKFWQIWPYGDAVKII